MRFGRETFTGALVFLCASVVILAARSPASAHIHALVILGGLAWALACAVFAALAAHLSRGPAAYEPIAGAASAWGFAEVEDEGTPPG